MNKAIANESEIPDGKCITLHLESGLEIALFKLEGKIYALKNVCPHAQGPLGEGDIDLGCVTCPWHGWQFDIKTGDCLTVPGESATKIPITVKQGKIYLDQESVLTDHKEECKE